MITTLRLISLLDSAAIDDHAHGYNCALIQLLQESIKEDNGSQYNGPYAGNPQAELEIYLRRNLIGFQHYNASERIEAIEYWNAKNRLQFIKLYKIITGCGLKESKDNCDAIWDSFPRL